MKIWVGRYNLEQTNQPIWDIVIPLHTKNPKSENPIFGRKTHLLTDFWNCNSIIHQDNDIWKNNGL